MSRTRPYPTIPADPDAVLQVIRDAGRPLYWSDVAAELHELVPGELATLPQVRGVRDACAQLEDARLVEMVAPLKYAPTKAGRKTVSVGTAVETTVG